MPDQPRAPDTRRTSEKDAALARVLDRENKIPGEKLAKSIFASFRSLIYGVLCFAVVFIGLTIGSDLLKRWQPEAVFTSAAVIGFISLICLFKPIPFGWLTRRSATSAGLICAVIIMASAETPKFLDEINQSLDRSAAVAEAARESRREPTRVSDTAREAVWIEVSKEAIRARLRDPSSAQFRNVTLYMMNGETPVVCGQVNGRNGFGGMSGYQGFIASGETLAFLESDFSSGEFAAARREMCRR